MGSLGLARSSAWACQPRRGFKQLPCKPNFHVGCQALGGGPDGARKTVKIPRKQQAGQMAMDALQRQQLGREEGGGASPRLKWMSWWDDLPSRYKVVGATFCSFIICNMVRPMVAGCAHSRSGHC